LIAHGFDAYEVSNHAAGDAARSRHNLAIWHGAEYIGVGPGAHGRIVVDGVRTATRGARAIRDYVGRVAETGVGFDPGEALSAREGAEAGVLLGLRIREGVPLTELTDLGLDPDAERIATLIESGLLCIHDDRLSATDAGRLVLDRLVRDIIV